MQLPRYVTEHMKRSSSPCLGRSSETQTRLNSFGFQRRDSHMCAVRTVSLRFPPLIRRSHREANGRARAKKLNCHNFSNTVFSRRSRASAVTDLWALDDLRVVDAAPSSPCPRSSTANPCVAARDVHAYRLPPGTKMIGKHRCHMYWSCIPCGVALSITC